MGPALLYNTHAETSPPFLTYPRLSWVQRRTQNKEQQTGQHMVDITEERSLRRCLLHIVQIA